MENFIGNVSKSIKLLVSEKINLAILLIIVGFCVTWFLDFRILEGIKATEKKVESATELIKKRVDYRYFNLNNSLQDLFNVEIETHHGRVEKK